MLLIAELVGMEFGETTDDRDRGQPWLGREPALDQCQVRVQLGRHANPRLIRPLGSSVRGTRLFDNWRSSLKWQRLGPYEKFAAMIDRHWNGIAAYCRPENKVPLGFVEGLNNKIRVIQRRAYGLPDENYLRFKILTCMLPRL